MSKELIENLLEYADIAEAGEKPHWALAMRQAAEYIRADLDKPLPEPICFASTGVLTEIPKTRIVSPHRTEFHCVPLYQEPQLYAEPPARSPIPDVEISKAFCDESGVSIGDTIEDAFEAGVRFGEQYHGIKEQE